MLGRAIEAEVATVGLRGRVLEGRRGSGGGGGEVG